MCGIVGYVGEEQAAPLLLEGLRRLEYRGYDSAGMAVCDSSKIELRKCAGDVDKLAALLGGESLSGTVGIAHTRWATHGPPTTSNAHPHTDCKGEIVLVHNGVIENHYVLRRQLARLGHDFATDTDSEVLAHLIEELFEGNLEQAVAAAVRRAQGALGIAVMSGADTGKVVVASRSAPLLFGKNKNGAAGMWAASDVAAVIEHTNEVVDLAEDQIAVLTSRGCHTADLGSSNGTVGWSPARERARVVSWDLGRIDRGEYPHYMLKEIHEQPRTIRDATRGRLLPAEDNLRLGGLMRLREDIARAERIVLTACGTSWHAALVGEYVIEALARIPVEVEYASEFRYRNPVLTPRTLVGAISQSGETADTLGAVRAAKRLGAKTFGIVNTVGSSIARETVAGVYTHSGPEIGVASTKVFVAQVTLLLLLGLTFARQRGLSGDEVREYLAAIQKLPDLVTEVLEAEGGVRQVAEEFADVENFLFLGRGPNFPVALEGALKMKETSYIHAEGYPAAEMKHGPIALIDEDMPVVFICPRDAAYSKVLVNIAEVKARGGRVIALVTDREDRQLADLADYLIRVPKTLPLLQPVLNVVPLQLLAYHIAVLRGCNVDRPRNLAKTVTVE